MTVLILIFAALILLAGMVIVIKPEVIFGILRKNADRLELQIFAIVVRLVLGALLIYKSSVSRYPFVIEVIGWISVAVAVLLALIGRHNFNRLMLWALSFVQSFGRAGGVLAAAFGTFLIYAFVWRDSASAWQAAVAPGLPVEMCFPSTLCHSASCPGRTEHRRRNSMMARAAGLVAVLLAACALLASCSDPSHESQTEHIVVLQKLPARAWLAANSNVSPLASSRFGSADSAREFVESLFKMGAVEVYVSDPVDVPEGGSYADSLIVVLPPGQARRDALFALFTAEARREGFAPVPDVSQAEVFLWWD